jgi:hypothetical protein
MALPFAEFWFLSSDTVCFGGMLEAQESIWYKLISLVFEMAKVLGRGRSSFEEERKTVSFSDGWKRDGAAVL